MVLQRRSAKFYALLSVSLFLVTLLALSIGNVSFIAAQLGLSTTTSIAIVNLLSVGSTVAWVITVIGMFSGVGTIGSAFAATVLTLMKKHGKAKAAAF
ncbi:membrane protein [Oceanobacillus picturae]|uniref:Membrane protein n=1 Tax=Oceanobacillus picturae TaxID=171693 RepID=A0A0U9HB46_9BACI|nr:uberolysin/carnocyclin family circular bacteriocin [Oceanobacillus picturae]GAQ19918.1 membrane protein [Oceanobacillus picturae]